MKLNKAVVQYPGCVLSEDKKQIRTFDTQKRWANTFLLGVGEFLEITEARSYGFPTEDGTLYLTLKVQTSLHISTGVVVMGSDLGNNRIPLIKTMIQSVDQKLSIQGSSLKGCIRSVYEAITNSTLAVITSKYRSQIPPERLPCRDKEQLCPASRVFGALDWQGLLDFNDAKCEGMGFSVGFMPSLYRPRPDERRAYFIRDRVAGRKFYYHTIRAIDKGQNAGVPVQQAGREYTFKTQLHFKNLTTEELGTLLVVLGQDPKYPIALKVGGGKPIGMGTMTIRAKFNPLGVQDE